MENDGPNAQNKHRRYQKFSDVTIPISVKYAKAFAYYIRYDPAGLAFATLSVHIFFSLTR